MESRERNLTPELLTEIMKDSMPRGETVEIAFVEATQRDGEQALRVVLRLITWDVAPNGDRSIRDIKEQEVYFVPEWETPERVRAFVGGWKLAVEEIFASGAQVETLMPHDLARADVLKLARAETVEDFRKALLAKSRLGRWKGSTAAP